MSKRLGLGPKDVAKLVRASRVDSADANGILVLGDAALADTVVRLLSSGGGSGAVGRGLPHARAAAAIFASDAGPSPSDLDALRDLTRLRCPVIAVRSSEARLAEPDVPYVYATDVFAIDSSGRLPTAEICRVLSARLDGATVAELARAVPAIRGPLRDALIRRSALRAAAISGLPWFKQAHFPLLVLEQIRLVAQVRHPGSGRSAPPEVAAAATVAVGAFARTVSRSVSRRAPAVSRAARVGIAAGTTAAMGIAARRLS